MLPLFCAAVGGSTESQPVEGIARRVCGRCGTVHYPGLKVAVAVAIVRRGCREEVLLVQRAAPPFAQKWSLPAGYVEPGEDPADAAAREVFEETQLTCTISRLLDVVPGEGDVDLLIIYSGRVDAGQPAGADDAADAGWFSTSALPPLAFPGTVASLSRRWGLTFSDEPAPDVE